MSSKITVIHLAHTGHILGALSRAGDPESTLDTDAVVPTDGLPVRMWTFPPLVFDSVVDAERLAVAVVDGDSGVLKDPRSFGVDPLEGDSRTAAALQADPVAITVSALSNDSVSIQTDDAVADDTPFEVLIRTADGARRDASGTMRQNAGVNSAGTATFEAIPSGTACTLVVLVQGRPALGVQKSVP